MAKKTKTMQNCPQGSFPYTIKSGDTLFKLAQRYNTTVEAITKINPGINPNNLRVGQIICIPGTAPGPTPPPTPSCPNGFLHTIRPGDTLFGLSCISQQFGVSVEEIMRANPGIDPNRLQIGQTICIPRPLTPTPPCPNGFLYTIRPGDNYFSLSQQFGISVDSLIRANPGVDPDRLQIGQIICIPSF